MRLKLVLIFTTLITLSSANAQTGNIRGAVFDATLGEYLPGVTIAVVGTTQGSITDLDGKFDISIAPGIYTLKVSYISYQSLNIEKVEVKAGEVTILDDIGLEEATVALQEVVVTAQAIRNTETALLTIKKKSANVLDGISAANFKKIGDSDAAASMKRVPGISVQDGKYVFVRGLGDRYTKTILNGVEIPGLDPDRNTLQMDLFPTSLIDNIIVHKSFSPELPADFTGGVIDINTKDFPEEKIGKISISTEYNPDMHFNSNYLTYEGGETDWLGFDDGTRKIPATSNIPFFTEAIADPDGKAGQRFRQILEKFNPIMAPYKTQSFMDFGISASFGNQFRKNKTTFGYNFVISYKNETEYYKGAEFGRYGLKDDPDIYEMEVREFQLGDYGVNDVLISGLAGFAMKTRNSKYKLNLMHLQNGESKSGIFDFQGSDQGSIFDAKQYNIDYNERSLSNILISGEHKFDDASWDIEWKLSPTFASIQSPDVRFTRYKESNGNYYIGTEVGFPERIWRDLEEIDLAGIVNVTKKYEFLGNYANFKFGGAYTFKQREYAIRSFALNIRDIPLTGDPNELFYPENLWPYEGDINKGTTYEARFVPNNANKFDANNSNAAAYVSTEINLLAGLKTVLGVRLENYIQKYTGRDQQGNNILDNDELINNLEFFPSVNFVYGLSDDQNIRLSYSKTIARPSFKELSYAEIYDPITGRTFIGGLFSDRDQVAGVTYWDGNLISTDIHNLDLRWEIFKPGGQMFSVSGFYKHFIKPIEIVQYATLPGAFQPRNVGDGTVLGAEAEIRLNLSSITSTLNNFRFIFNFTYTDSRIQLSSTELESREKNARTGQKVEDYRDMAGQAPYIINGGISYDGGEKGFWKGFEGGLYYNVQGPTLLYAGIVDRPDIYSEPFHSLNFNSNKRFGKGEKWSMGLKVKNILGDKKEQVFQSFKAADQYFERLDPGRSFSLSLSYRLF